MVHSRNNSTIQPTPSMDPEIYFFEKAHYVFQNKNLYTFKKKIEMFGIYWEKDIFGGTPLTIINFIL